MRTSHPVPSRCTGIAPSSAALLLLICGCPEDPDGEAPSAEGTFAAEVRIDGGEVYAVRIDPAVGLIPDARHDPAAELDGDAADAVDRAPDWVQADLARTLWGLEDEEAERLAAQVLDADEDWVDEIAWSIAATDVELLRWMLEQGDEDLFSDNAEGIYALDGELEYAALVELDDGRTTLELIGEQGAFQLPEEDYYRNVVYPRAYLELPATWDGEFWRTFFVEDDTHGETLLEAVADAGTLLEAAEAVGAWIQSFMTFGYGTNELWPVEIYFAQFGSCGQYSILTTAAARTVFIPTVTASARADDHEWNELWDGRWVMWDNSLGEIGANPNYPYVDWPEVFDDDSYDGAGVLGEVAHVFRYFGDESIEPSDLYTEYKPVYVDVVDGDGRPLEAARVVARSHEAGYAMATWSYTDATGRAELLLGDDLAYGFEVNHPLLGDLPEDDEYEKDAQLWSGDEEYFVEVEFEDDLPVPVDDQGDEPGGELTLSVSFEVLRTEQRRTNCITEPYELGQTYPVIVDGGSLDVYLVEEEAWLDRDEDDVLEGYALGLGAELDSFEVALPTEGNWVLVLDNSATPNCHRFVDLEVVLAP